MSHVRISFCSSLDFKTDCRPDAAYPDRDIALTLGWVLTVLQTSILQLPEDQLSTTEKVEALAAINKVGRSCSPLIVLSTETHLCYDTLRF